MLHLGQLWKLTASTLGRSTSLARASISRQARAKSLLFLLSMASCLLLSIRSFSSGVKVNALPSPGAGGAVLRDAFLISAKARGSTPRFSKAAKDIPEACLGTLGVARFLPDLCLALKSGAALASSSGDFKESSGAISLEKEKESSLSPHPSGKEATSSVARVTESIIMVART